MSYLYSLNVVLFSLIIIGLLVLFISLMCYLNTLNYILFIMLILLLMKFTSKQFKTKSAYFMPFLRAWYLNYCDHLIYKVSIVYVDGTSYSSYCSMISYNVFHRPMVKSAMFSLLDKQSYSTELQFFVSFLVSCNDRQLVTFLDDMFDSVTACPDEITAEFLKVLPTYIGESRFRIFLNHIQNE